MSTLPGLGALPSVGHQDALIDPIRVPREILGEVPNPVARVHVLLHQPHLDKTFDYLVPKEMDEKAVSGARVQVKVAELKVDGYIVERTSTSDSGGVLRPLLRVYSGIPVLSQGVYASVCRVAERYAGSVSDVLNLAVPQRHARAEKDFSSRISAARFAPWLSDVSDKAGGAGTSGINSHADPVFSDDPLIQGKHWVPYGGGQAFLRRLASGKNPWAICHELPGNETYPMLCEAIRATRASGRGALIILPTAREARLCFDFLRQELDENLALMLGNEAHERRYTTYLEVLAGLCSIVVGTRSAVWAPVHKLGLCAVIDDASPSLHEVRSPYYEIREVAAIRAHQHGAALLIQGSYISPQALELSRRSSAVVVRAEESLRRIFVPRISAAEQWDRENAHWSRIPESAFRVVREGLQRGPVLVVVPRSGYFPLVACENCLEIALCLICGGGMSLGFNSHEPKCSRCNTGSKNWRCSHCGSGKLRAVRIGSHRTAEEIGRAFPGVGILVSGAQASGGIIDYVPRSSKIIVATPGSEPYVDGGYAAGLVVDSRFLRGDGPGADVEFIRKISRIASRISPAAQGGHLIFAGGIEPEFVRALGMWKQDDIASEILEQRSELMLPPAYRWLAVKGKPTDVRNYLAMLRANLMEKEKDSSKISPSLVPLGINGLTNLGEGMDVLGPVDDPRGEEVTVYIRPHKKAFLHPYIRSTYREYSGKQIGAPLRIEVDPLV